MPNTDDISICFSYPIDEGKPATPRPVTGAVFASDKILANAVEDFIKTRQDWVKLATRLQLVFVCTPLGGYVLAAWSRSYKDTNFINAYHSMIAEMIRTLVWYVDKNHRRSSIYPGLMFNANGYGVISTVGKPLHLQGMPVDVMVDKCVRQRKEIIEDWAAPRLMDNFVFPDD